MATKQDEDDTFQVNKIPGMSYFDQGAMPQAGDPGYNSGVAEKDPLGQAILDSIGGIGASKLAGAMSSDAGAVAGNETGSLDFSALKRLIGNSADDVAGAVVPSPSSPSGVGDNLAANSPRPQPVSGPNADALATQIKARAIDQQQRFQQQLANRKLAALLNK